MVKHYLGMAVVAYAVIAVVGRVSFLKTLAGWQAAS